MIAYYAKLRALEARAALIDHMTAALVHDGERLVTEHHTLSLAFRERMNRAYRHGEDEFTLEDEQRAEQLLELLPESVQ
jgi:hypothetical protein